MKYKENKQKIITYNNELISKLMIMKKKSVSNKEDRNGEDSRTTKFIY